MEPKLQKGHFVKFLGAKYGTDQGGMCKMYEEISKLELSQNIGECENLSQAVSVNLSDIDPADLGLDLSADDKENCPTYPTQSDAEKSSAFPVRKDCYTEAMAAYQALESEMQSAYSTLGPDHACWGLLRNEMNRSLKGLLQAQALKEVQQEDLQVLSVNRDAPDNWSLQRLKGPLERGGNRRFKKCEHVPKLAEESPVKKSPAEKFPVTNRPPKGPVMQTAIENVTAGQQRTAKLAEKKVADRLQKRDLARSRIAQAQQARTLPSWSDNQPHLAGPLTQASQDTSLTQFVPRENISSHTR